MDCLRDVQNVLKRTEASTCCQIPASYFTNYQHSKDYSSTAACAATNKGWISVYYVKFGKYLGNILNIFCVFCTNTSCLRKFLIILKCYRQCKRAHSKQIKRDVNKTHSACFPFQVNDYFWNKASLASIITFIHIKCNVLHLYSSQTNNSILYVSVKRKRSQTYSPQV